ncbi:MAG: alpha-L-fucosidase [Opitutales bacterium]
MSKTQNSTPRLLILMLTALLGAKSVAQSPDHMIDDPTREARMQWWREARFGLFIHWGLYSIPAGEWKGEISKKNYAEWAMHNFQIPYEEYKELAKEFNPTEFDPEYWAKLADEAGMGYFVLTTKHHDGFALFDSKATDYDMVDATPYGRDIFGQLVDAFRDRGMRAGAYYSQDIDWSAPQGWIKNYNTWDYSISEGDYTAFDKYMYEKSLPQVEELATNYGDVDVFWFDVPRMVNKERGKVFHDLVRKYQPNAVISGRIAVPQGAYADYLVPGDNGFYTSPQGFDWECCATMNESWGYTKHEKKAKSSDEIVMVLLKTVSSGGNLLLNIGPKPDGTLPADQVKILEDIAVWMKDNKEAIHGTQANPFNEFFGWGYCTVKGSDIYLHVSEWEDGKVITVPRLNNKVSKLSVLGDKKRKLSYKHTDGGVEITLKGAPVHNSATVIKLSCEGDSLDISPVDLKMQQGSIALETRYAKSKGQRMSTLRHSIVGGKATADMSGGHPSEELVWEFIADKPGTYAITALCMEPEDKKLRERTISIQTSGSKVSKQVSTQSIENGQIQIGEIEIAKAGPVNLSMKVSGGRGTPIYLKSLNLSQL